MLELLLIILLILILGGGWRWKASGPLWGDAIGIILLVFIVLIVLSIVLGPWPYHHRWFGY